MAIGFNCPISIPLQERARTKGYLPKQAADNLRLRTEIAGGKSDYWFFDTNLFPVCAGEALDLFKLDPPMLQGAGSFVPLLSCE